MLLRRFEAYGFKSFADKVELDFGAGVTAIVGPNGSGKSNISDAIRWVLGEQNIRNIRGAKTEDIIFAGSSERRPLNVAEVSLIFDNTDNKIPLDYSEVIITRRVYRSGDSEYLINKTACRLKDIHDLLGDVGLGRESMAVISQSKVDEVLNSRPEDRRLLFEDAAGITKYKHRKRDALRKLEDTESNITRVADIMAELSSQLGPLSESAACTEQYNRYQSDLTACQVSMLLSKIDSAQSMLNEISKENEILTDQHIAESVRLSAHEAEAEELTHQLSALEQLLQEQDGEITAVAAELERTDSRIAVLQERSAQKHLAAERVDQDVAQLSDRLAKSSQDQAALEIELDQKRQCAATAESEVAAAEEQLAALIETIVEKEQQLTAASDGIFANLQEISTQRNLHSNLDRDLLRYQSRRQHLLKEEAEYNAKLTTAAIQSQQFNAEHARQESSLASIENEIETLTSLRTSITRQIADLHNEVRQTTSQITQRQSRLTVLLNMQKDLEGFNRGSKSVLTSRESWRKGVCGAVAQIITVPDQYLTAIEVALGGALQDIITEDEATVRAAIHSLKQQNAGRVTFLPITNIKPRPQRDFEARAAKAPGAVGLASGLVRCESRFRDIIEQLLGRVLVADNLEHALAIAKQFNYSLKIVTLDGELINPGGAITGGSLARRESSYLGRTGEIHDLEQVLTVLKRKQDELETSLAKLVKDETSLIEKSDQLASQRHEIGLRQAQLAAYQEQAKAEITRLTAAKHQIAEEIVECQHEETQLENKRVVTKENIVKLEQIDISRKQAIDSGQTELKTLQQQKEQLASQTTDRKIALSAIRQEMFSFEHLLKSRQEDRLDIENRVNALAQERTEVLREIHQAEQEFNELILVKQGLSEQKQEHDAKRFALLGRKADQLAVLQKIERDSKELRRRASNLESRLHELQLMITRYELESSNSLTQLHEQHGVSLAIARTLRRHEDPQTLIALIQQIEQQIASLGPVNPSAIDEYARAKDRYEFLEHQHRDLVTAKEHLTSIIGDIDSTMAKRFLAAFEAINTQFMEIFPRLFGGGKAKIELNDSDDVLGSGIEIFVQPPGKKQQNLALLSGGERALTVIALLFSLLAFRPAPFSVVDEIDAALDEANVQRFSEFLREFSRNTQFIVVTHRKGTMEVADVMHGVTMEDSGVSRIVSVRFMEKAG